VTYAFQCGGCYEPKPFEYDFLELGRDKLFSKAPKSFKSVSSFQVKTCTNQAYLNFAFCWHTNDFFNIRVELCKQN